MHRRIHVAYLCLHACVLYICVLVHTLHTGELCVCTCMLVHVHTCVGVNVPVCAWLCMCMCVHLC